MKLGAAAENIGTGASNIGLAMKDAPKAAWGSVKEAFSGAPRVAADMPHPMGGGFFKFVTAPARWGFNIMKQPFSYAGGYAGEGLNKIAGAYKSKPLTMLALTAGGVYLGGKRLFQGSAEERTNREFQAKMGEIQAIQAQTPQMQGPVANTYVLQPGEYARDVEPRLKQAGTNGSQVEALQNRQAATPAL